MDLFLFRGIGGHESAAVLEKISGVVPNPDRKGTCIIYTTGDGCDGLIATEPYEAVRDRLAAAKGVRHG